MKMKGIWTLVRRNVASCTNLTAKEFLLSFPPESTVAYTTCRTVEKRSILEFHTHIGRVASTLQRACKGLSTNSISESSRFTGDLRERIVESLRIGEKHFRDVNRDHDEGELRITIVAEVEENTSCETAGNVNIACHFVPLPPRRKPPIYVEARKKVRDRPWAKTRDWIKEREPLERLMSDSAEEVILLDGRDRVLEGTQTNFFAVQNGTIYTAGGDLVLEGTIRKLILEVCENENISVVFDPPSLASAVDWEGAFLTSVSRLVLPIDRIVVPQDDEVVSPADRCYTFEKSKLIEKIERETTLLIHRESVVIF